MGGCSSDSLDVVDFDGILPIWDNLIKVCSFNGFWPFFSDSKRWLYVIEVIEFNGKLFFVEIHQEMAELPYLNDSGHMFSQYGQKY